MKVTFVLVIVFLSILIAPVFAQDSGALGDYWEAGDPAALTLTFWDFTLSDTEAQQTILTDILSIPIVNKIETIPPGAEIRRVEGLEPTEHILRTVSINFHSEGTDDICMWITIARVSAYVQINDTYCGNSDIHPRIGVYEVDRDSAQIVVEVLRKAYLAGIQ